MMKLKLLTKYTKKKEKKNYFQKIALFLTVIFIPVLRLESSFLTDSVIPVIAYLLAQ